MTPYEYHNGFIPGDIGELMFTDLWNDLSWIRHSDAPRREYWTNEFNRDYTYGKGAGVRTYEPQSSHYWINVVSLLLDKQFGHFEGCFLNGYENCRDWLGWHSDDDLLIDYNKPIAIVTLYEPLTAGMSDKPRTIEFREYSTHGGASMEYGPSMSVPLGQGGLCLMPAGSQFTHQHRIPKAGWNCRRRISMTFRGLLK